MAREGPSNTIRNEGILLGVKICHLPQVLRHLKNLDKWTTENRLKFHWFSSNTKNIVPVYAQTLDDSDTCNTFLHRHPLTTDKSAIQKPWHDLTMRARHWYSRSTCDVLRSDRIIKSLFDLWTPLIIIIANLRYPFSLGASEFQQKLNNIHL